MRKLVLGNASYVRHMTDEGLQLQNGLAAAGWMIAGRHLAIDEVDVPTILEITKPDLVFVQDVRDWHPRSLGAYDASCAFERWHALRESKAFVTTVLKDAGSAIADQRDFANEIGARALVSYYHPVVVRRYSPWAKQIPIVRTYHTVDPRACYLAERVAARLGAEPAIGDESGREERWIESKWKSRVRGCVSGALSKEVYPYRCRVVEHAEALGLDVLAHPGYGDQGSMTQGYLELLLRYKVSVATASRYGFALRKIIEAAAMGCAVVTNLVELLPLLGHRVYRPATETAADTCIEVDTAVAEWDPADQRALATRVRQWYDWRAAGRRLSLALEELAAQ